MSREKKVGNVKKLHSQWLKELLIPDKERTIQTWGLLLNANEDITVLINIEGKFSKYQTYNSQEAVTNIWPIGCDRSHTQCWKDAVTSSVDTKGQMKYSMERRIRRGL